MKKRAGCLLLLCLLLFGMTLPCFADAEETAEEGVSAYDMDYSDYAGITINVYNWGEYISDGSEDSLDVIKEFEDLTGIRVNYETFDSNESMYAKLKSGATNYDVLIPSDYMIARLLKEDMLEPLDFSLIPNYRYVDDVYKGLFYDPDGKYTAAYTASYLGLIYNTAMVEEEPDSWGILWDEDYFGQILMINNPRDAFGVAQFYLGQSVNTLEESDWEAALQKLLDQKPLVKGYVMDEVFNKMEAGSAALVPYFAGDFLTMYCENEDLAFVYPKEGTNIFVDAMCIPKGSRQKEAASLFINFMLEPEIAIANAEYICYGSPCSVVYTDEDYIACMEDIHEDAMEILYPSDPPKSQYYEYLPNETQIRMNELWEELKVDSNVSDTWIYISCGGILLFLVFGGIVTAVRRKKRSAAYDV